MKLLDIITEDNNTLFKRAETIFKGLRKGVITIRVDYYTLGRHGYDKDRTFTYDLGDVYIIKEQQGYNKKRVRISVPDIKIHCEEDSDLDNNSNIKAQIKTKISDKFTKFNIHFVKAVTEFYRRNDKWYPTPEINQ